MTNTEEIGKFMYKNLGDTDIMHALGRRVDNVADVLAAMARFVQMAVVFNTAFEYKEGCVAEVKCVMEGKGQKPFSIIFACRKTEHMRTYEICVSDIPNMVQSHRCRVTGTITNVPETLWACEGLTAKDFWSQDNPMDFQECEEFKGCLRGLRLLQSKACTVGDINELYARATPFLESAGSPFADACIIGRFLYERLDKTVVLEALRERGASPLDVLTSLVRMVQANAVFGTGTHAGQAQASATLFMDDDDFQPFHVALDCVSENGDNRYEVMLCGPAPLAGAQSAIASAIVRDVPDRFWACDAILGYDRLADAWMAAFKKAQKKMRDMAEKSKDSYVDMDEIATMHAIAMSFASDIWNTENGELEDEDEV